MDKWLIVGAGLGLGAAIIGAILGWGVFPPVVRHQIDEGVTLIPDTEQFERWVNIPQPLHFKVWIFNVTNVEEVQNGGLPNVEEIGPYIYNQYRHKTVHSINNEGKTITYTQHQRFEFDRRASAPLTESDRIVALNIHMNSILQTAEETMSAQLQLINLNINGIFDNPTSMFVHTTVGQYLFNGVPFCVDAIGIAAFICNMVKQRNLKTLHEMPDGSIRFSFFYHKNTTHDGVYEVNTGLYDTSQLTYIQNWDGNSAITTWLNNPILPTSTCNMINGTDASSFPPHREPGGSIHIFSSDICRSVQLFYDRLQTYKGINGLRFQTTRQFLHEIGPEYSTECFCTDGIPKVPKQENGCLYTGALDLSNCLGEQTVF